MFKCSICTYHRRTRWGGWGGCSPPTFRSTFDFRASFSMGKNIFSGTIFPKSNLVEFDYFNYIWSHNATLTSYDHSVLKSFSWKWENNEIIIGLIAVFASMVQTFRSRLSMTMWNFSILGRYYLLLFHNSKHHFPNHFLYFQNFSFIVMKN